MDIKRQWVKRIEIMQYIYACLINDYSSEQITTQAKINFEFDTQQQLAIDFFALNKQNIIESFVNKLDESWSIDRISLVQQAILYSALAEHKTSQLGKKIIIDQALITTSRFCGDEEKKFINGILDKVLV